MAGKTKVRALILASLTGEKRELAELAFRCDRQRPARADMVAMQKKLHQEPLLWHIYGDMTSAAEHAVISWIATTPLRREAVKVGQEARRRELGYDTASPLERGLIEHVVLCRLRLDLAEQAYSRATAQDHSFALGEYWDRLLSAAQRRYLRAVETLARIRRLGVRTVQINLAEQQVNVAGDVKRE